MQAKLLKILAILTAVVGLSIISYQAGRQSVKIPAQQTKIEYVDRVVEKEVKVYVKQDVKDKTKTTTTKPDGTVVVEEKNVESNTTVDTSTKEKTKEKILTVDKKVSQKQWRVGIDYGVPMPTIKDLRTSDAVYGGRVEHRLIGPVSGGLWYLKTDKSYVGLTASWEL